MNPRDKDNIIVPTTPYYRKCWNYLVERERKHLGVGKELTEATFIKLIAKFGVQKDENLSQWLRGDLNYSEINKVNNLLKTKGIDYTF